MADNLEISWEKGSVPFPVLKLKGRLDAIGAPDLHEAAMSVLTDNENPNLVVDLAGVEFVASTGLAIFLLLHEEFSEAGGKVVYVNADLAVIQVIELLNIDQFLNLQESAEAGFEMIGA